MKAIETLLDLETRPTLRHEKNRGCILPAAYPDALTGIFSAETDQQAFQDIRGWPDYAETPLEDMRDLAAILGIDRLYFKDEGDRFGLGSFKALGGAYAVGLYLLEIVRKKTGQDSLALQGLLGGKYRSLISDVVVACATAGNHGRSVAWGARLFGCQSRIYVHKGVTKGRCDALRSFGADVIRVDGNYDDSVATADRDARDNGWAIISDTAYEGYDVIPSHIMRGYTVLVEETLRQIPQAEWPTHVFVQGGVGGLAAAVCAHFWIRMGKDCPRLIVVEAERADCLLQSAAAGHLVTVGGDLKTMMLGLSAGKVSTTAWDVISPSVSDFLAISDDYVVPVMKLMASGAVHTRPVVVGEAGTAGLAALLCAAEQPDLFASLGLDRYSRVLVIGTEGATDPTLYAQLIGTENAPSSTKTAKAETTDVFLYSMHRDYRAYADHHRRNR